MIMMLLEYILCAAERLAMLNVCLVSLVCSYLYIRVRVDYNRYIDRQLAHVCLYTYSITRHNTYVYVLVQVHCTWSCLVWLCARWACSTLLITWMLCGIWATKHNMHCIHLSIYTFRVRSEHTKMTSSDLHRWWYSMGFGCISFLFERNTYDKMSVALCSGVCFDDKEYFAY